MSRPSTQAGKLRPPHPLAESLIARLRRSGGLRVLEIGSGNGRNTIAIERAGLHPTAIADSEIETTLPRLSIRFDGALSTHALLHGTVPSISETVAAVARLLRANAPFYATFGSTRDRRYGYGARVDDNVYVEESGDEAGVEHAYFAQEQLRTILQRHFTIEYLAEVDVDEIAGSWAHRDPLRGAIHWFAHLHRTPA